MNEKLKQFYQNEGIEMQLTADYSPEQNDVAERRNRYLQDVALCMLVVDADLEKHYWGEACIQNRQLTRSTNKTPFELWCGQKPYISHLKVFGCGAFVRVPDAKRAKMESKGKKLIFVCCESGSKAYRFLNKQNNKIIISRDAKETLASGGRAVGSKLVFKETKDSSGQTVRFKARLVASGFAQQFGEDYEEVFALVAMQSTLRVFLNVAGHRKYQVRHIDVKNAYLNGSLQEEIFMSQPPGYAVPGKEKLVCRLRRNLCVDHS